MGVDGAGSAGAGPAGAERAGVAGDGHATDGQATGHGPSRLRLHADTRPRLTVAHVRLALLPVAGGLALVLHVLASVALPLAFGALLVAGAAVWWFVVRRAEPAGRADLARRVRVGLVAGVVATIAYDVVRYTVVAWAGFSLDPFHAWSLFGAALVGTDASAGTRLAVGTVYHLVNGVGFAVAFTLVVRRPTLVLGLAWGLALELTMVWLYPQWMRIAQLQEFVTVSVLGHLAYGGALALTARRLLERAPGSDTVPDEAPAGARP
jgi:hypothetical protein